MITSLEVQPPLPNATDSGDATVAAGSHPTWSAWTELIASTAITASGLMICLYGDFGSDNSQIPTIEFQFAIGAAASEINLFGGHTFLITGSAALYDAIGAATFQVKREIGPGMRISFRSRTNAALSSGNVRAAVALLGR